MLDTAKFFKFVEFIHVPVMCQLYCDLKLFSLSGKYLFIAKYNLKIH